MEDKDFLDNDFLKDIADTSEFETASNDAIIKVIGVGGGGSNAVSYMYEQKIPNVNFVICNTDKQHLQQSAVPNKVLLGFDITGGRGAGNKPEVGRQCAEADRDKIRALFNDQTEMVFITAGMGGGTGTGAAPVVAQIAKEAGMLTIGIVTVPFMFEGEMKVIKAINGADEMKKHVDALLVINNQNLLELYKDLNFFNAFGKADDTLANAARSISDIISEKCYINVDFQDVKTTLKDSGTAIISTAYGSGEHRISDAINNALHSPLLKKHDINTAQRLLFKFSCWKDSENYIRAEEINEISKFTSKLPKTIDVKWGIADDPSLGDQVKFTILASGFDLKIRDGEGGIIFGSDEETAGTPEPRNESSSPGFENFYDAETLRRQKLETFKSKYAVLLPEQMDNSEIITLLERTPAFNRSALFNESLMQISQQNEKNAAQEAASRSNDDNDDPTQKIVFNG
ncbi:MAG: cell division protein FtsZ [Muribaculaceae bacterium]|nr:cell division protein FtsZ [Muribaculaceae bacterium]